MADQSLTEVILKELAELPEQRQEEVLTFVRFLKIGLADADTTAQLFRNASDEAKRIAESQNITGEIIEEEIREYRTKK